MNSGLHGQFSEYSGDLEALERVMNRARIKKERQRALIAPEYDAGQKLIDTWLRPSNLVYAAESVLGFFNKIMHKSSFWRDDQIVSRQQRLLQSFEDVFAARDTSAPVAVSAQPEKAEPTPHGTFVQELRRHLDELSGITEAHSPVVARQFDDAGAEVGALDPYRPHIEIDKAYNWYDHVLNLVQYGMIEKMLPQFMELLGARDRENLPAMATLAEDLFAVSMTRYAELAFGKLQSGEDIASHEIKMGNLANFAAGLKDMFPDIADPKKYDHLSLPLGLYLGVNPSRILKIFEHVLQSHSHTKLEAGLASISGDDVYAGHASPFNTEADAADRLIEGFKGGADPRLALSGLRLVGGKVDRHPG